MPLPALLAVALGIVWRADNKRAAEFWDYQRYCGASIFRRDAPAIESLGQMRAFMRYNEHATDELYPLYI